VTGAEKGANAHHGFKLSVKFPDQASLQPRVMLSCARDPARLASVAAIETDFPGDPIISGANPTLQAPRSKQ
jgi:hypothetical protein